MALLTLFRIATGDNWNGIMKVYLCFNLKYLLKTLLFLFYKLGYYAQQYTLFG
jgi:hypothetical protein